MARELGISDDAKGRKVLVDALMDANEKGDLRPTSLACMGLPYRIIEEY